MRVAKSAKLQTQKLHRADHRIVKKNSNKMVLRISEAFNLPDLCENGARARGSGKTWSSFHFLKHCITKPRDWHKTFPFFLDIPARLNVQVGNPLSFSMSLGRR
jgi:hypothetical protein